jgi:riboflavin kinase/FMN adenylyltransferase
MKLLRRPASGAVSTSSVVTIGAFDGLHVGHQAILARVQHAAAKRKLPSVVFSFEPLPREFFARDEPPPRLTRFREKYSLLQGLGIDVFFCPPFNQAMGSLSPDDFIEDFLIDTLRVQHLVVGDDFRFAHRRSGTLEHLQVAGERRGFTVERVGSVTVDGERVSSTSIRAALATGDMPRVRAQLGRNYRMTGRVVPGRQLGKKLGYPTANVNLNRRASPVAGIFAVRVDGLAPGLLDGVASVGTRPTIDGVEPLLEVHVFDFDRDIYGALIEVEFIARLRDEVRFDDLESLTEQMHRDAAQARAILAAA